MQYDQVLPGTFLSRPNRFVAWVRLPGGQEEPVHVKNTGRCRELLVPGRRVWLEDSGGRPGRKTRFSLIAVEKGDLLINMDSQAPNQVAAEAVADGSLLLPGYRRPPQVLRREVREGDSRFDLFLQGGGPDTFLEVKGVTLEEDGAVYFPDAPTLRGAKHLRHLAALARAGQQAAVLFVIQMERAAFFAPNLRTHPDFGAALWEASQAGVAILAHRCRVAPDRLTLGDPVPVRLVPPSTTSQGGIVP